MLRALLPGWGPDPFCPFTPPSYLPRPSRPLPLAWETPLINSSQGVPQTPPTAPPTHAPPPHTHSMPKFGAQPPPRPRVLASLFWPLGCTDSVPQLSHNCPSFITGLLKMRASSLHSPFLLSFEVRCWTAPPSPISLPRAFSGQEDRTKE